MSWQTITQGHLKHTCVNKKYPAYELKFSCDCLQAIHLLFEIQQDLIPSGLTFK